MVSPFFQSRQFLKLLLPLIFIVCALPAQASDADAMLQAARYLRQGDSAQAIALWQPLAERGVANAQYNLGIVYLHGDGVKPDDAEALKWFRLAAEQGDRAAQQQLGVMILHGRGIAADPVEGYRWINRKHHDHMHHNSHLAADRERAAKLIWQSEMEESLRRNQGDFSARMLADLKRRAGMLPAQTELAAR